MGCLCPSGHVRQPHGVTKNTLADLPIQGGIQRGAENPPPVLQSRERSEPDGHEPQSSAGVRWSETKEMFSELPEQGEGATKVF